MLLHFPLSAYAYVYLSLNSEEDCLEGKKKKANPKLYCLEIALMYFGIVEFKSLSAGACVGF